MTLEGTNTYLTGDHTPAAIVARVYANVDRVIHRAAEQSVRAHLDELVAARRLTCYEDSSGA